MNDNPALDSGAEKHIIAIHTSPYKQGGHTMNAWQRHGWIVGLIGAVFLSAVTGVAGDVVLSEIAWAGTSASANDEWMEIHNRGDVDIDLIGWEVRFADVRILLGEVGESTVEARTSILPAGGFLLLERTDDTTVADIDADVIYKGLLPSGGVRIDRVDPSGVVVDWIDPEESGWPGGGTADHPIPYGSMERTEHGDWVSNNGQIRNGLDAKGDPINGTPKQLNSAEVMARRAPAVRWLSP
ncbi:MAG TPA: lamin tail domain-containing protein, partial [Candidatus Acetothermia bacterium]|nr:lamin tail domain-containing protein [Candidatus Acetothermia bacterium]